MEILKMVVVSFGQTGTNSTTASDTVVRTSIIALFVATIALFVATI